MAAMKRNLLLSAMLCLLLQVTVFAQSAKTEEELVEKMGSESFSEVAPGAVAKPHVITTQTGNYNNTTVSQQNISTKPNAAFIMQVGSFNRATLQQQGAGNQTLARQIGANNSYTGEISGTNNAANVLQNGNSNSISQRIDGVNLEHTLIQLGNNNTINQVETSPDSRSYKVVQQGNNMNITIEQSNWGVPAASGKKQ